MFTPRERARLLDELLAHARADSSVTGAAIVGSGAAGRTDAWSDLDLALRLDAAAAPEPVADVWALWMGYRYQVADQLDLWAGPALYRVFLLASTLQVDLSFWPASAFASTGEPFALVFGEVNATPPRPAPDPRSEIGWAWLHALHARSALTRGQAWQALQMVDGLRDRIVTLACLRHELPAQQGRGVDRLPAGLLGALQKTLVPGMERHHLGGALAAAIDLLLEETRHVDATLAERLRRPLHELAATGCHG